MTGAGVLGAVGIGFLPGTGAIEVAWESLLSVTWDPSLDNEAGAVFAVGGAGVADFHEAVRLRSAVSR